MPTLGKVQTQEAEPLIYKRTSERPAEFRCKPWSRVSAQRPEPGRVVVPAADWAQTDILPFGNSSLQLDA